MLFNGLHQNFDLYYSISNYFPNDQSIVLQNNARIRDPLNVQESVENFNSAKQ